MLDILKLSITFIAILILLRRKLNIGYVLLIASGLLSLLYVMPFQTILVTLKSTATDPVTIKLFFALTLIKSLELILREQQILARMMEASRSILKKKKAVIISMPMLIGMLPSLGGAYFSAPMVEESTKGLNMSQEEKGFINYWFRHPWEYILPLYPGILLASAITGIELRSLILANLTYALLIFITGFIFSMRGVKGVFTKKIETSKKDLWSFLPLLLILLMVMVMHIELHYALGFIMLMLFVFYRLSLKDVFRVIKHGITVDVIVIVFGTMLFKFTMENSGAVAHLSQYFKDIGIPILPILFILPFISGLLTGLTVGFVSSTFPLLISLAGGVHLNEITFAFASGFVGVLLSPVHLCFVLTKEYFKADIAGIYRKTIPASTIIMIGAIGVYFIL